MVAEDQDYCVCTVVLFKRVVDNFKTAARQKGFQVRACLCASAWGRVRSMCVRACAHVQFITALWGWRQQWLDTHPPTGPAARGRSGLSGGASC